MARVNELVSEYEKLQQDYTTLLDRLHAYLKSVLDDNHVNYAKVEYRCKKPDRVRDKLTKLLSEHRVKPRAMSLDGVHDLVGLRVITYYHGDIDEVCRLVEQEFPGHPRIDKASALDPSAFGYQSIHYRLTVTGEVANRSELKRFAGKPFELQVRSQCQHAWAEPEHELGYINKEGTPAVVRRRLARIASLL